MSSRELVLTGANKPVGIYDRKNTGGLITGIGKIHVVSNPFAVFVSVIANPTDLDSNEDPDADGISNDPSLALPARRSRKLGIPRLLQFAHRATVADPPATGSPLSTSPNPLP